MSLQRLAERADQRLDLAPLGRDLAGVGEAFVVELDRSTPMASQLVADALAFGRQVRRAGPAAVVSDMA